MIDVALVACSKTKGDASVAAQDLYTSPLFKMSRRYAETQATRWLILSAKHGLLDPKQVISPYNTTLNSMCAMDRKAWPNRVMAQMNAESLRGRRLLILAGQAYRKGLMQFLWTRFDEIAIPMDGLKIGEQLSWLSKRTQDEETSANRSRPWLQPGTGSDL